MPMSSPSAKKERRKKRRWGDAPSEDNNNAKAKSSGGDAKKATINNAAAAPIDAKSKALALQASIAARLAALKASKAAAASGGISKKRSLESTALPSASPPSATTSTASGSTTANNNRPVKKAKVYDLDMSIITPQFKKQQQLLQRQKEEEKKKKKMNPYLAHLETDDTNNGSANKDSTTYDTVDGGEGGGEEILDNRLGQLKGGKNRVVKSRLSSKKINFVEPGTFVERAKKKHLAHQNAIQSGYRSGRKQGTYIEATAMATIVEGSTTISSSGKDHDYYGSNANQDARSLVPRVDAIYTSHGSSSGGGGTKDTNGVVPIPIPLVMEWWDIPLLPKQLRKDVIVKEGEVVMKNTKQKLMNAFQTNKKKETEGGEAEDKNGDKEDNSSKKEQSELETLRQTCFKSASITNSKTHQLVQHPKPIIPPSMQNLPEKPKAVLHLTKKELKRQRKLRRAEKQREIQDLQSVGLLPKPEAKLTLSNYMRVLGTQAVLDPSQMEQKVQEQIQARKLKHEKMNLERKVKAKEIRDQKKEEEEKTGGVNAESESVSVALFLVQDMSHRYHRTKVDLNAQQWKITGGVLECQSDPQLALVIAEGDAKAIKKYIRLMTVRMKWKGENFADDDKEDEDEDVEMDEDGEEAPKKQKFNKSNKCELVWTGMAAKRMFRSFIFQTSPTSDHARKVLEAKGVAHFWDQVLTHNSGTGESFNFKLG